MSTWRLSSGSHFGSCLSHLDDSCLGERTQRTGLCVSAPRKMAGVKETPNTLQYSIESSSLQREWSPVLSLLFWASSRIYSSWLCLFFLASLICHDSCLPTPQEGKLHLVKRVETRFSTGVQPHHVLSLLPFALQTEAVSPSNSSLLESEPTYLY